MRSILVCRSSTNATLFIDFDTVLICHYIVQVNLLFICSIFNRFVVEVRNTRLDEIGKYGLTRDLFGSTIVIVQILRRNVWLLCWHYVNYFMFVATSHSQSCFIIFHPMCLSFTFLFHTLLLFFMVGKLRGTWLSQSIWVDWLGVFALVGTRSIIWILLVVLFGYLELALLLIIIRSGGRLLLSQCLDLGLFEFEDSGVIGGCAWVVWRLMYNDFLVWNLLLWSLMLRLLLLIR